jgi:ubiquinol-cytochrome c reductase cytochrome b subunit
MFGKRKYPKGTQFTSFIMEDILVIFIFMVAYFTGVFFFPEWIISGESEIPADPFNTPEHIKPEWYFLAAYQFLKVIPSEVGALILQAVAVTAFVLLPFIDRSKEKRISKRPFFFSLVIFFILFFVGFTIWGAQS